MKSVLNTMACVCVAMLLCTMPTFAQTVETGAIIGRAQDSTGAVIPGVEVTITSPQLLGGAHSQVTDEQGVYRFELFTPLEHIRVSFALPGFKSTQYRQRRCDSPASRRVDPNGWHGEYRPLRKKSL